MKSNQFFSRLSFLERRNWNPTLDIRGVSSDSRRVKPGEVFVACPGPASDGHRFLGEAYEKGARVWVGEAVPPSGVPEDVLFLRVSDSRETLAELLNRFYDYPSKKLRLIGVTGTNGKTTVVHLLNYLLGTRLSSASIGTLGYQTPSSAGPLNNTTPGAEELYSLLDRMVRQKVKVAAMEVSSHSLHQKRVFGLSFEVALFTQLTSEHLDYHQNLEEYFLAKRLLFSGDPGPRQMLINRDSPYGRRLLGEHPRAKNFSVEEKADFWSWEIATSFSGSEFIFEGPQGAGKINLRLPFLHNVANATSVLGTLALLGFDPLSFKEPLKEFPGVPGRLEPIEGQGFQVFVDYAHTPDAFENILSESRRLAPRRVLTVFGCGGDRDPFKRPEMTRIAYHYSDIVILTSDNPRTEDPGKILRDMRCGLPADNPLPNVLEIPDRREAIAEVLGLAEPGDVVFILGKGHEDYQILGHRKVHFDDREVVRDCLKRKKHVVL